MKMTGYRVETEGAVIRVVSFWDEPVMRQEPIYAMEKELPVAYVNVPGIENFERVEYEGFDPDEAGRHIDSARRLLLSGETR